MDYFFWVIRNAEETILVDTGFSRIGGDRRRRTMLIDPPTPSRLAGYRARQSAPPIIVTHAHFDHVGNLGHFPHRRSSCRASELDFWNGPHADETLFAHSVEAVELAHLRDCASSGAGVTLHRGRATVAPGVELLEIGGHTPGQCIVLVDTTEGTVAARLGRRALLRGARDRQMPFMSVADLVAMYDGFALIRELVAYGGSTTWSPGTTRRRSTASPRRPVALAGIADHRAAITDRRDARRRSSHVSRRFDGTVALVTGQAAASAARRRNDSPRRAPPSSLIDVNGDAAEQVAAGPAGRRSRCTADVSNEAAVDAYVGPAVDRFGRIDLHHLNAGIFGSFVPCPTSPSTSSSGSWPSTCAASSSACAPPSGSSARSAGRLDRRHGSIASLTGAADLLPYHTSKHAVVGLIHGAAVYGGPLGIRVNGVAPGIVPTDLFAAPRRRSGGKNDMERRASTTPLRRAGTADEIAGVAAFLLSDDAAYVTGQIVSAPTAEPRSSTRSAHPAAPVLGHRAVDDPMYAGSGNWSARMTTVGFIGLGNMGGRMTRRIVDAGIEVLGFDAKPENIGPSGATPAASAGRGRRTERRRLPLAAREQGRRGGRARRRTASLAPARAAASSSISARPRPRRPAASTPPSPSAASPTSTPASRAEQPPPRRAQLTLMVGGERPGSRDGAAYLAPFASNVFHVGASGAGHVTKLLNNFLNAIALSATAEVMVAGRRPVSTWPSCSTCSTTARASTSPPSTGSRRSSPATTSRAG